VRTRRRFSDDETIRARAKQNVADGIHRLRRWWTNKYKLPSSHPSFQNATLPDLMIEFYEDLHEERETLEARRRRSKLEDHERDRLTSIQGILDGEAIEFGDPLIEKWEREIAEGRIPDLDEEG
jgi:hypothetical protein